MAELRLTETAALGNGTRPAGFVIADIDCPVGDCTAVVMAAHDAVGPADCQYPCDLLKAEDVTDYEVFTALRSNKIEFAQACDPADEGADTESDEVGGKEATDAPVSELGLSSTVVQKLTDEGLYTASDVKLYAVQNDGLTGISGIGEPTEQAIMRALGDL